jgi:hypothetical protein
MQVTEEHIFGEHDKTVGYDIRVEASEMGIPPGPPPQSISVELPSGEVIEFGLCGQCVDSSHRFIHWSYWNDAPELAINLQIFND